MKVRLTWYRGDAVWEPAEGGHFVPVSLFECESKKAYKMKHALREFRKIVKYTSEDYGDPVYLTRFCARWRTGPYIGDEIELRIESEQSVGRHEERYHGYC